MGALGLVYSYGCGTSVLPMNTGRGIDTETFGFDNVCPLDDIRFGSDTQHEMCCYMHLELIFLYVDLYIY